METGHRLRVFNEAGPRWPAAPIQVAHWAPPALSMLRVLSDCCSRAAMGRASQIDLRFNPLSWVERGVGLEEQLTVLDEGRAMSARNFGIHLALFVTLKQEGLERDWELSVDFAVRGRSRGVMGVDVSRSYDLADPNDVPGASDLARVRNVCRQARRHHLDVAVHCGWYDDQRSLELALDSLEATRLGHALPLGRDRGLLRVVAGRAILVEVCPTAYSRRTGRKLSDHPLPTWIESGVRVQIGTDHPMAFDTNLAQEYAALASAFPGACAALAERSPPKESGQ
jgi:adenosine deaminase